ncbi:hypothetical protein GUJ93_ZPchr0012g19319 [Zizania palustris]|uniref:Uncharacterized protein n=1 Tax=Zizania palustris TaxID=103762 RepID=A0A8J6BPI5_ZIZPA|nr:hypothetical protein GUJ93_ZPchr0012g19319 [Zizania palustris]
MGSDLPSKRGKSIFWNFGGRLMWCWPSLPPLPDDEEEGALSFFSDSTSVWRIEIMPVSFSIIAARSSMVVVPMAGVVEEADGGEGGGLGGGGAVGGWVTSRNWSEVWDREDEDHRTRDTRLSRAWVSRAGGPLLRRP